MRNAICNVQSNKNEDNGGFLMYSDIHSGNSELQTEPGEGIQIRIAEAFLRCKSQLLNMIHTKKRVKQCAPCPSALSLPILNHALSAK